MRLHPESVMAARALLAELGAPSRLLRHVELVGEAGDLLLAKLAAMGVRVAVDLVRVGIVVHDAGKIVHQGELDGAGSEHEATGEALLLKHGVSPELARSCVTHARWDQASVSLEELLVALADKLWKGVRSAELEERVVDVVATRLRKDRWDVFLELDTLFEEIAAEGASRLERSRL